MTDNFKRVEVEGIVCNSFHWIGVYLLSCSLNLTLTDMFQPLFFPMTDVPRVYIVIKCILL